MPLSPGTRLGQYEVVEAIGAGSMGEVYKATDLKLGRDVAIKVLRQEVVRDPDRLRRFEQEARAASALNHPNIVTIYEIGEHEGTPYIAMELVVGVTLREMLAGGPLQNDKLMRYARQLAEGLAKAHQAGIVHRDLKPENIVISEDGYLKILDFGLAKLLPQGDIGAEASTWAHGGTTPGAILGTVGYMSPEQAKGRSADFRSDQFSLGAILYEMASGKRAFERESATETLAAILENEPELVTVVNPKIPATLVRVIGRCLETDPAERYASTWDIVKDMHWVEPALPAQHSGSRRLAAVGAIGILAIIILIVVLGLSIPDIREWVAGEADAPRIESIAVLPLENLSGDPDQEYFSDGMTEALIADLAKIKALKVISRTSVMQYKGARGKSLPEIARELGVDAVIEGSALRVGDRVRITVQLIRAETDELLWAESYERELKDVLAIQSEVARAIVGEVRVTLTPEERELLARSRVVDPEAHEAYLRGRFYWNRRSPESLLTSVGFFEEAISIDPEYALAHVGLADAQQLRMWFLIGAVAPSEAMPRAKASLEKALEIDASLGEAHAALAGIAFNERDWERGARESRRAIELSPSSARAHQVRGMYLTQLGHHEEAMAALEHARQLDPLSLILTVTLGLGHYMARDYDEALAQYQEAFALDPDFYPARILSIWVYAQREDWSAAIEETERGRAIQDNPAYLAKLGQAHAAMGRRTGAIEVLAELTRISERAYVDGYHFATVHLALGDHEKAIDALEQAFDEHSASVRFLKVDPALDPLRAEPRFEDLLRRMKFPE